MEALQHLTVAQLFGGATGAVLIVSTFLEITPFKINPISAFLGLLGKKLNAPLIEKVDTIEKRIDDNERDRIRYEIMDFANSCRNRRKHSKEEFVHIFDLNTKYHDILARQKQKNGQITVDMEYIKELYHKCQNENDFLA